MTQMTTFGLEGYHRKNHEVKPKSLLGLICRKCLKFPDLVIKLLFFVVRGPQEALLFMTF